MKSPCPNSNHKIKELIDSRKRTELRIKALSAGLINVAGWENCDGNADPGEFDASDTCQNEADSDGWEDYDSNADPSGLDVSCKPEYSDDSDSFKGPIVQVIHQSVLDFLLSEGLALLSRLENVPENYFHHQGPLNSPDGIRRRCLIYLNGIDEDDIENRFETLYDYAKDFLISHRRDASSRRFHDLDEEVSLLQQYFSHYTGIEAQPIHWASREGLPYVVTI